MSNLKELFSLEHPKDLSAATLRWRSHAYAACSLTNAMAALTCYYVDASVAVVIGCGLCAAFNAVSSDLTLEAANKKEKLGSSPLGQNNSAPANRLS